MRKAMTCPENVHNKIYLLEAERSALRGKQAKARKKYLSSIRCAKEMGFIHEEALAHERLSLSLSLWGFDSEAQAHRKEAATLYHKWGFNLKATQLTRTCGLLSRTDNSSSAG